MAVPVLQPEYPKKGRQKIITGSRQRRSLADQKEGAGFPTAPRIQEGYDFLLKIKRKGYAFPPDSD